MRLVSAGFASFCGIIAMALSAQIAPARSTRSLYDPDRNHLWNRVHEHFHVRAAPDGSEYGFDTIDPLLWRETKHLLTEPSHGRAVRLLDEFLASNGERLVRDPLTRAVFQHDLWAIFDWLASTSDGDKTARTALMGRLARVIRRLALNTKEIAALPDTYAAAVASGQPSLPPDLSSRTGPWVSIGGTQPIVPQHAGELGRSAFIVLWNLPDGRGSTADYLRKLWDFPEPFVLDESFQLARDGELRLKLNPALPPVPDGARIALVRKMLLIDDTGTIVPSNIVQSIQLRVFAGRQLFSEFRMSRRSLFDGKSGGLAAVSADDRELTTFSAKGMDPLEQKSWRGPARVLDRCTLCHQTEFRPALETVLSVRGLLRPYTHVDVGHDRWARWFTQPIIAAEAKSRSFEWGLLQGWWQSQPR